MDFKSTASAISPPPHFLRCPILYHKRAKCKQSIVAKSASSQCAENRCDLFRLIGKLFGVLKNIDRRPRTTDRRSWSQQSLQSAVVRRPSYDCLHIRRKVIHKRLKPNDNPKPNSDKKSSSSSDSRSHRELGPRHPTADLPSLRSHDSS